MARSDTVVLIRGDWVLYDKNEEEWVAHGGEVLAFQSKEDAETYKSQWAVLARFEPVPAEELPGAEVRLDS